MPWREQPLMANGIYIVTLALTFIPGATKPLAGVLQFSALNLFVVAAVWCTVMVRGGTSAWRVARLPPPPHPPTTHPPAQPRR